MTTAPILAKSVSRGRVVDLVEHSAAVQRAARRMFGSTGRSTRLGEAWLRFFALPAEHFDAFIANLTLACVFHDLGKCSEGFQAMIRGVGEQLVRHEHLSAFLLASEPLRSWLEGNLLVDRLIVQAAVVSHHAKASDASVGGFLLAENRDVLLRASAREVAATLALAEDVLGPAPAELSDLTLDEQALERARRAFRREMHAFERSVRRSQQQTRHRLLLSVKAALVAADSAGSALVREGMTIDEWIDSCFAGQLLTHEDVWSRVITPRIAEVERKRGTPFVWQEFQKQAECLGPRALIVAGCGAGKTLAAWRWIAARLRERPAMRVLFLYPTRATATEGFRDYVSWAGEDAALQSGTASFDLTGLFDNCNDARRDGDYHVPERLFALGFWTKRVFSATVDSFLAFMAVRYAPLCMLPVLADSVVVFDEVHSFDDTMFAALERFLEFFPDVPVLCMTASLPQKMRRVLVDVRGLKAFPDRADDFEDLAKLYRLPRYRVRVGDERDMIGIAAEAVRAGKRVLWVTNTVRRCQKWARKLQTALGDAAVLCYHSRFRLLDRKSRHSEAVSALQIGQPACVLVTTQVCEMSLDLDADVLISEVAPIPSLIQRSGRCCRHVGLATDRVGRVFIYWPSDVRPHLPYTVEELRQGWQFAEELLASALPVSQEQLAELLARQEVITPFARDRYVEFIDNISYAMAADASFRDDNESSVDAVLDADVAEFLQLRAARDVRAEGLILPVPRRAGRSEERLGRFIQVASARRYSTALGFCDEEVIDG